VVRHLKSGWRPGKRTPLTQADAGTKPLLIARLRGEEPPSSHQKRNASRGAKSPAKRNNALVSLGDSSDDEGDGKSDDDDDARPVKGARAKRQRLFDTTAESDSESRSQSEERDECVIA
jgi:hypothetical protein